MPGDRHARLDLSPYLNNGGIAPDGRTDDGGLDGMGTAFRAESLPSPGTTILDGLLVGAGEHPSSYDDASAVESSSWARIKAALGVRP